MLLFPLKTPNFCLFPSPWQRILFWAHLFITILWATLAEFSERRVSQLSTPNRLKRRRRERRRPSLIFCSRSVNNWSALVRKEEGGFWIVDHRCIGGGLWKYHLCIAVKDGSSSYVVITNTRTETGHTEVDKNMTFLMFFVFSGSWLCTYTGAKRRLLLLRCWSILLLSSSSPPVKDQTVLRRGEKK